MQNVPTDIEHHWITLTRTHTTTEGYAVSFLDFRHVGSFCCLTTPGLGTFGVACHVGICSKKKKELFLYSLHASYLCHTYQVVMLGCCVPSWMTARCLDWLKINSPYYFSVQPIFMDVQICSYEKRFCCKTSSYASYLCPIYQMSVLGCMPSWVTAHCLGWLKINSHKRTHI